MQESSVSKDIFVVNVAIMNKMLAALNECTEWGQIAILTSLADYRPLDSKEAENVCERVVPRLQHANGSVVLSAIRVIMIFMRYIRSEDFIKGLIKKMSPPLGMTSHFESSMLWVVWTRKKSSRTNRFL